MTLPRKWPVNKQILAKLVKARATTEGETYLVNRNPRNLEFLRIANKPYGYKLEKDLRCYWNKLLLTTSAKFVTLQMVHWEKGPIVEASTSEWAIKKQLFKTSDTSAYINLGKVFAQRCLESGFIEMKHDLKPMRGGKVSQMLMTLRENGLVLREYPIVKPQIDAAHFVGRKSKPYGDWEEH